MQQRLGRKLPGLLLGLVLLATVGVVLASDLGSAWLAQAVGGPQPGRTESGAAVTARALVDWPGAGAEAASYLQAYLRFDTAQPAQAADAARWLQETFSQAGIESHLVPGPAGRMSVLARIPGSGGARPLILYGHLDAPAPEVSAWSVAPFSGAVQGRHVYGVGAVDPKGQTIANLAAMLVLQRLKLPLERDVVFLATADEDKALAPGSALAAEVAALQPEYLLGAGGGCLQLGAGQWAWMVATSSRGKMVLRVAPAQANLSATGPGASAGQELVVSVNRMLSAQVAVPSDTTNEFFRRVVARYPFPVRELLAAPGVWSRVVAPRLLQSPVAAGQLCDSVSLVRLEPWPDDPQRPSAILQVGTMPGRTREQVVAELVTAAQDRNLRFQLLEEVGGLESPWDTALFSAIEGTARREDPRMLVLPSSSSPDGSRYFRAQGVVCYGFLPFDLDRTELERIGQGDERLSLANLELGVRRLVEVVVELCSG